MHEKSNLFLRQGVLAYLMRVLNNAMDPQRTILEALVLTLRVVRERAPNIDVAEAALKEERAIMQRIKALVPIPATQPQPEGVAA